MSSETIRIYYSPFDSGEETSHQLLQRALARHLADVPERVPEGAEPELIKGPHGKPYFAACPDVRFSVSHSGGYWACAFAEEEVGLDLQKTAVRRWEDVAKRFFHPAEQRWLEGRAAEDFTLIWAYKESYIKYTGEGLSRGLESFRTVAEDGSRITGADGVWQQQIPFPAEGYRMVLTARQIMTIQIENL